MLAVARPTRSAAESPLRLRQWKTRVAKVAVLAVACIACGGFSSTDRALRAATAQVGGGSVAAQVESLRTATSKVAALQAEVESGSIISDFGAKAEAIVAEVRSPDLQKVVDGALHTLFLQQVASLRQQIAESFEGSGRDVGAVAEADEQFVSEARTLVRPGSTWEFEAERAALRMWLEDTYRRDAALAEERASSAKTQQATVNVISKLQDQMELLAQKAQGLRSSGSPWVLSTTYRIPNSPLQVVGKYEQGRADVEINLTPTQDPAHASGIEKFGPANFGVSFNLGI